MAEVYGTWGDDTIAPEYVSQGVWGVPGNWGDIIYGYGGSDGIDGGAGNDTIYGDAGEDIIYGGLGDDYVSGGADTDWIEGREGNDTLRGGSGDDYIFGGDDDDDVSGGTGNDWVEGGDGDDTVRGLGGNDFVFGGEGDDLLAGGSGDDYLVGAEGNDSLNGGGGMDYLYGDAGADYFYFYSPSHGPDVIVDFDWQEGDKIVISSSGFGGIKSISLVNSDEPDEGEFGYTIDYLSIDEVVRIPITYLYYTDFREETHLVAALYNYTALDQFDFLFI